MRISTVVALLLLVPAVVTPQGDADIQKILVDRIDVQRQGVGIVVGIVDAQGRRFVAYGKTGSDVRLNGDTIFEMGSVSKVFTSLLLADAVARGEMSLSDPIAKYLPASVKVPARGGKQITLQDLAMHTSALPRLPTNLAPKDMSNPYAHYSVEQMYAFLSSYELTRDIGERYEYSNLGAGLLGHVLSVHAKTDYESLVRKRITEPLGMRDTAVALTPGMKQRLATGHNAQRVPVPNWDIPTLAGAGAIRSSANDMLTFLSAELGLAPSPLAKTMESMLVTLRPTPTPRMQIGLGWHVLTAPSGGEVVWHNGGTGGYRTFVGFNRQERRGVVVLSNMSTPAGADDIGRHLLDPLFPLLK